MSDVTAYEQVTMEIEEAYRRLRELNKEIMILKADQSDVLHDCRWAMSMLVNGIEGRLVDIHEGDLDKVLKAARRMPAFKRAQAWLEAHPMAENEQTRNVTSTFAEVKGTFAEVKVK